MTTSSYRAAAETLMFDVVAKRRIDPSGVIRFADLLASMNIAPDTLKPVRGRASKFSREAVDAVFRGAEQRLPLLFDLVRTTAPAYGLGLTVHWAPLEGMCTSISGYLGWKGLADDTARMRALAEQLGETLSDLEIVFGKVHNFSDVVLAGEDEEGWVPVQITDAYWLNWYGNDLVERLGRARVESTPAAMLKSLPDGSVLWTTRPGPADYASDEARVAQARAVAHLTGASYDEILSRLHERSAKLAPLAPAWDPDLDPVFARLIAAEGRGGEPQAVARWNAYVAPEVTEWKNATDVVSDVEDGNASIEQYRDDAERFVALFHEKIPQITQYIADVLPALDAYFFFNAYPESFPRADIEDHLVPALGGYVGQLLVSELGGRWIPRKRLEETAVVIGARAWLPFARAHAYFRTRESAIDASMTKFYRVIERSASAMVSPG